MAIEYKIKDVKLQYYINWKGGKISALPSGTIDKYEHLQVKNITIWSNENSKTSYVYIFSTRLSIWKTNKNNWPSRNKTSLKALK